MCDIGTGVFGVLEIHRYNEEICSLSRSDHVFERWDGDHVHVKLKYDSLR